MGLADFKNAIITEDKFSGTFRKFDTTVQGSASKLDRLGSVFGGGGVMALFGGAAGIYGATQIAKQVWALGQLGAQSLTTKASFDSLMASVGQSPQLLNQMKQAAGGTVTQLQLMQQANTALAGTQGQLSNELAAAMPKLIEAARAAAMLNPAYGDATFMLNSLVGGVKRGTPLLIDNTGIVLKVGEATEAYAKSLGKSANELTSQERSIAILRATLAGSDVLINQVGGSLNNMASDMQRATVAVQELKTVLGEAFAPTIATGAANIATPLQRLADLLSGDKMTRSVALMQLFQEHLDSGSIFAKDLQADIAILAGRIGELNFQELETGRASNLAASAMSNMGTQARVAATGVGLLRDGLGSLRDASYGLTGGGLSGDIGKLIGSNPFFGSYSQGLSMYSGTGASFEQANRGALDFANSVAKLNTDLGNGKITVGQYMYELERLKTTLGDATSAMKDTGSGVSDLENKMKGLIGQQLSPTFDLSGLTGGLLGGMGGDSFDEAYKRLAAVALRPGEELAKHQTDWADTFEQAGLTGLSPEEAQKRAQELVEAYSKGLDFSLIDKEKIKDSVRQAIKAEELYNSIVDEIYDEMGKERGNNKLDQAFYKMGQNGAGQVTQALKDGTPEMIAAWVGVMLNPMLAAIYASDARFNQ